MLYFPNISPPMYPLKEEIDNPVISSDTENGMRITRARYTRLKRKWTLQWDALRNTKERPEYEMLRDFYMYKTLGGANAFLWTYPPKRKQKNTVYMQKNFDLRLEGKQFLVRFISDTFSFEEKLPNVWTGSVQIEEV